MLSDKLANDAEVAKLTAKAGALASAIHAETATAQKLTRNQPRLNELALQVAAAEESYRLLTESDQARLTEAITASELVILNQASVPTAPARPIKILHVATSLPSLALAARVCFFVEVFDSSIQFDCAGRRGLGDSGLRHDSVRRRWHATPGTGPLGL